MCHEILNYSNVTKEDLGRIHNLLGMCNYFINNDLESALKELSITLEYFDSENMTNKLAAAEANIGVINNIMGKHDKAEQHWDRALELNSSVGNLNQEGILLINYGIYYFERLNFEKAIEYYLRAHRIFSSLGSNLNKGIVLSNLGEVYLTTCNYEKAYSLLLEAQEIFEKQKNIEELAPVILLLAQFYTIIGQVDLLTEVRTHFIKLLDNLKNKKLYELDIKFIDFMISINNNENIDVESTTLLKEHYLKKDNNKNFVFITTHFSNYLIENKEFNNALEELNNSEFIKICKSNNIYMANREYLLGLVSRYFSYDDSLPAIEHFEEAYELLEKEGIVELTWKILYTLAETYTERGNFNKAKSFIIYTRDLINLIAENIETTQFKTAYLQKEERLNAMEKLEQIQIA